MASNFIEQISPGVIVRETVPANAPANFSPAKAAFVGWTDKGPSHTPMEVSSFEEFKRAFGPLTTKGLVPIETQGFFGTGGERAWIVRVVPGDSVKASVGIDSSPGPTKFTFTANGEGVWGNDLKVRIRGNRNFLNRTTNSWDKFDLLILAPFDADPTVDSAEEVYEQVQFTNPATFDYVANVINDPRRPSMLVTLTVGASGTPTGMLPVNVTNESIGTGGGSPLTQRFTATLAQIPVLDNTLTIKAVSNTVEDKTIAPTSGSINGTNKVFAFQVPLGDLPVVEGSAKTFYQQKLVTNELIVPDTGAVDGTNRVFTFATGTVDNEVHREVSSFSLRYAIAAGASPQTLTTLGGTPATYNLSATALTTTPVHPGSLSIAVNVNGVGASFITDNAQGVLSGTNGSLPGGGTINYTTGAMTGITTTLAASSTVIATYQSSNAVTKLAQVKLQYNTLSGTPKIGDTITVGAATATIVRQTTLTATTGFWDVNPLTGVIAPGAATFTPAGPTATIAAVTPNNLGQIVALAGSVSPRVTMTFDTLSVPGALVAGDSLTQGAVTGTVVSVTYTTATTGSTVVDVTSGQFVSGTVTDTTATTSTFNALTVVNFNTIDQVNSLTTPTGSGAISVRTAVAPVSGSAFYLTYVALGIVSVSVTGVVSGDALSTSTFDFTTGLVNYTFTDAPLSGSTIEFDYLTGQLVRDNGLGKLIGDVAASGTNTINYETGAVDVTFAVAPPTASTITATYTKLAEAVQYQLTGGSDGTVVSRNDISNPTLDVTNKGIYALDSVEEPLNVVVPDFEGSASVQADIVDFCDSREGRYGILSFANGMTVDEALQYALVTQAFDSKNCAIYYPNINYMNDLTGLPEKIPASGFVAGVYAKTARNKNVGKSPGGLVDGALDAPGIIGPEFKVELADRDRLYAARINPLMTSAATGFVVWGIRSLSREVRWRYINARLLHNFLTHRLKLLLNFVVFENNGPALWAKVTAVVDGYMNSLYRLGYFGGDGSKSSAFSVLCNGSNNNSITVSQGKLLLDCSFTPGIGAERIVVSLAQPVSVPASTI